MFKILLVKWKEITIIALVVVIIFLRSCQSGGDNIVNNPAPIIIESNSYKPQLVNETKTLILKETIPFIKRIRDTVHDTTYIEIDTASVVNDWLIKRDYSDTLINNDTATIIISDIVQYNKLQDRSFSLKIYPQTVIDRRFKMFVGLGVSGWVDKFGISGNIALQNKRDHLYMIGYDPVNKVALFSMYWKISLRKHR